MSGMGMMEYKGFQGTVEFSPQDNLLFGKVIGVQGLISYEGDSVQSIRSDFEAAIDDYLEECAALGVVAQKVYKGSFNVRISPELHRKIAAYANAHQLTLNATVETALQAFVKSVST